MNRMLLITALMAIAGQIAGWVNALIAPTLPYRITGSLAAYRGAFEISETAYRPFIKEVMEGLAKNGFRNTEPGASRDCVVPEAQDGWLP